MPIDGYKLLRMDRQRRRGGGVVLYVGDGYDCFKHKYSEDRVECLCVRIRGKANRADVVGVYYRPPTQDREVDEIFYRHLGEISRSLALVLVGDFNFPESAGNTTQQSVTSPEDSWNVWGTTS